ncbi:Stf0 family sulfotransferase [Gimibacter soli]|uniref:Stf0 family sulfotransferase n=1 Tax=Gimibacter soli TaxID=3024400 RepID=A0AAF0BMV7_9PROT|nr:Stf0 family sulfotransferase [Gimibacter soli]WCL55125.1 Stf0 family sulfotransferase [Gimibacter soli]
MQLPELPAKKIILCATQRCGSTMICEDMRNAGVLGQPEEYFLPWNPAKSDANWPQSLGGIIKRATSENGVFAVKLMANQIGKVDACLAGLEGAPVHTDGKAFPHVQAMFGDAVWVWLRRDDLVRQAISREMATQTGVNHATAKADDKHFAGNLMKGYKADYNQQARFNEHALAAKITAIVEENLLWQRFFHDWGIEPLTLHYEENCKDFPGYLQRLAAFAGIELAGEFAERKMVRLSNARNDEWFEAYTNRIIADASGK